MSLLTNLETKGEELLNDGKEKLQHSETEVKDKVQEIMHKRERETQDSQKDL